MNKSRVAVAFAMVLAASPLFASDHAAGADRSVEELVNTRCKACHGEGVSPVPTNPHLGGQQRSYLQQALTEYHEGKRKNAIMGAQAKDLTQGEIKALALWYSRQPGKLYVPKLPD